MPRTLPLDRKLASQKPISHVPRRFRESEAQDPNSSLWFEVSWIPIEHPDQWATETSEEPEGPETELYTDERIREFLADDEAISDEELGRLQEKIDALARQKGIDQNALPSRRVP